MPKQRLRTPFFSIPRRYLIIAGAVLVAIVALAWLWQSRQAIGQIGQDFIARSVGAKVEHILVEGADYTDPTELKTAIGLNLGDPLVNFDVKAARARIEALPWVAEAAVSRRLPDTIRVAIFEHAPIARLRTAENELWLITKAGTPIVPAEEQFAGLPILNGSAADSAAANLFSLLVVYPNFSSQLQRAEFVGERRWDLFFKSGLKVKLPAQNAARALTLLQQLEQRRHVLSLVGGTVDLRLEDRVVLELPVDSTGADLVL